jgi:YegS/Rv2252/BmrU family lipid kinase
MTVSLIVNPSAGNGRTTPALAAVLAELGRRGMAPEYERTLSLEHARDLAREAAAAGRMPVAFGGDGLIGAVADSLAHTGVSFGVLPGGRGNDIARVLGIPRDPVAACAVLSDGRDRRVDLGRIGRSRFIGILSCGLDAQANAIANATRWVHGPVAYSYGALRALARWQEAEFALTLDGTPLTFCGYSVAVANSRSYGGGMLIAPHAEPDDGCFDVVLIGAMPKLRLLAHMPEIFLGRHIRLPEVTVMRASTVTLAADRGLAVYADGEPQGALPSTVSIDRGAASVRVPR